MSENSVAKFLADAAKGISPELAEDYYKYAKSLLSPDLPPVVVVDHIDIITPERYEQNNLKESKERTGVQL